MKKSIIISIFCLVTTIITAQDPLGEWDVDSSFTPMHIKIDSILRHVDKGRMATNFLLNRGVLFQDPQLHNGELADSTKMNKFKFQSLYYTMHSIQTDSIELLP